MTVYPLPVRKCEEEEEEEEEKRIFFCSKIFPRFQQIQKNDIVDNKSISCFILFCGPNIHTSIMVDPEDTFQVLDLYKRNTFFKIQPLFIIY